MEKLNIQTREKQNISINNKRDSFSNGEISFVWTSWRDEVKSSCGKKMSMKKALSGKLSHLLK